MVIDSSDPTFVSYRQSDGTPHAVAMAWALRAAGVPVWHDTADLPPGETNTRLAEALASGLSGAVLIVTPEIEHSTVVKTIELPALLDLARDPAFTFAIASTVYRAGSTQLDHDAPDRLLGMPKDTLSAVKQYPIQSAADRADLARWFARRRLETLRTRIAGNGGELLLDMQTRIPPFASKSDGDLVLRLQPPHPADRRPNRAGLDDLDGFAAGLPQLLALGGANAVRVRGGAHLSVAFALGAAMPTTLIGSVHVVDTNNDVWTGHSGPQRGSHRTLLKTVEDTQLDATTGAPVLVFADLRPGSSDPAYAALRDGRRADFSGALHVRASSGDFLDAVDAHDVVAELDDRIRSFASEYGTTHVHLLLRSPYGIALLLGRRLNTLRIVVYEWEDGPADDGSETHPRYLPSMRVRSGVGGSPIEEVCLPERPRVGK